MKAKVTIAAMGLAGGLLAQSGLPLAVGQEAVCGAVGDPAACRPAAATAAAAAAAEEASLLQFDRARKGGAPRSEEEQPEACPADADWIVVGGGAAGCGAASALADAGEDVLVLERGPSDRVPSMKSTQSASGWPKSVNDAGELFRWTEGTWGAVAKVLGGGTSLNGGLYLADRPEWFKRALPGVDLTKMYASYTRLREELAVPSQPTNFGLAWNSALTETGNGVADLSKPRMEWISEDPFVPYTTFNFTAPGAPRHSAAALLHDRDSLPNLHVVTDALVHKVVFDGKRAVGVRLSIGQDKCKKTCGVVRAKKGVVVSAGAVMTPKLLQISGVGPRPTVTKLGVDVVADLPVGMNFTDRLVVPLGLISPSDVDFTVGYTVRVDSEKHHVIEGVGGGQITSELAATSLAFIAPHLRGPPLRKLLKTVFSLLPKKVLALLDRMIQPVVLQTDTHSRGYVFATSPDVEAVPSVTANYFQDPRDWASQQERFSTLLKIVQAEALANFTYHRKPFPSIFYELMMKHIPQLWKAVACFARDAKDDVYTQLMFPCAPVPYDSQAARDQYLRDYVISSYHYFGTASVGDVVDHESFAVKGTEGLYVADASVIPFPTTVNPQGTIMALGHYVGSRLAETGR